MENYKYKVGDSVWIKGTIQDIDRDDDDNPYEVSFDENGDSRWFDDASLIGANDSDAPLVPGTIVRLKNDEHRFGKLVAITRGVATVDWAPGEDDPILSNPKISQLLPATAEEEAKFNASNRS